MQALRKPLRTDVGITAPRLCVEAIMPSLVLCMKFLRLRIYKRMGITPRINYIVERVFTQSDRKFIKIMRYASGEMNFSLRFA